MTLSQDSSSESLFSYFLKNCTERILQDDSALAECQKAAERGSPIAQVALAQLYRTRRASPTDAVLAYKWYLIAAAQISKASKSLSQQMTMEHLLQAEKMASDWLKAAPKLPAASIGAVSDLPPATAEGATSS